MLGLLIILGLTFAGIGFLLNEQNAPTLLAGYNTMSAAEQQKVDIGAYLGAFKRFHLFLGISIFLLGLLIWQLDQPKALEMFLTAYPMLAYIYFIRTSAKYWPDSQQKMQKMGIYVLIGTLVVVLGLIVFAT
ncbi:MAG: DUF3784 domain-containing protein [Bacteroidota bacterium]